MRRNSSAAFAASRSAIRRLRSATENVPAPVPAVCVVLRSDDITFTPSCPSATHQGAGMAGNHQILIGFYNISGDVAVRRADSRLVLVVGCLVELQPEPGTGPADGAAHRCGILADAGGEDDSVEAAERRRERADPASRAIVKHL